MCMMKIWLKLIPELGRLSAAERVKAIDQASKASFRTHEAVIMVIWLVLAYLLNKSILASAPGDTPVADALATNLMITLPLLLLVVVPIYLRKMRREIRQQLQSDSSAVS